MTTKTKHLDPAGLPEGTIRAFLIDPVAQTVAPIELDVMPGEPTEGYGDQIKVDQVAALIECEMIDFVRITEEHVALVDDEGLLTDPTPTCFWQMGPDCQPIPGKAIICGHDDEIDEWHHAQLTAGELREEILFTKRSVAGFVTTIEKHGDVQVMRKRLVAPILQD